MPEDDMPQNELPENDMPENDLQSQDEAESRAGSTEDAAVDITDTVALGVAGDEIAVQDSVVGAMAAGTVEASDTFIVLGAVGSLEGDSRVLIDTRAAVLMGLVFALVLAAAKWLIGGSGGDAISTEDVSIESEAAADGVGQQETAQQESARQELDDVG